MRLKTPRHLAASVLLATTALLPGPAASLAGASQRPEVAAIKVGDNLPDFSLPGADGHTCDLGRELGSRRLVLVIFRGTW
jgi:hypothetical protein